MYIAPSSGHTSFNFNMPFKLILRTMWGCFLMSGVKILHFLKDWWKSIPIHQNYTMALTRFSECLTIEEEKIILNGKTITKLLLWSNNNDDLIYCYCFSKVAWWGIVVRLMLFSGADGHVITLSEVPDGMESYYSPQVCSHCTVKHY